MTKVFLTGATGVLGSAVLMELCQRKDLQVICLIRGQDPNKRLEEVFSFYQIAKPNFVTAVSGDITENQFGLSHQASLDVKNQLTNFIHCAASVDLTMPIEVARKHSVFPTAQVINFLADLPACKLDYVSTVGVNGKRNHALPETQLIENRSYFNTYEQSKAEAETLIYASLKKQLKGTVHRPSMVIGDSRDGKILSYQIFYHIIKLLCGFYTRGFQPDIRNFQLDTVPVDFVSKTIVTAAFRPDSIGRTLNICSGSDDSIKLGLLQDLARKIMIDRGISLPRLSQIPLKPFAFFISVMKFLCAEKTKMRLEILEQLLSYTDLAQPFENQQSLKLCQSWGLKLPKTADYIPICLARYAQELPLRNTES